MTKTNPTDTDYPLDTMTEGATVEEFDAPEDNTDQMWLDLAASNFNTAKSYQDAALTTQWERNADHFNSRHYRRSVYNSKQFRGRSRLFRPLTRAAERSASAQFAGAMFSNMDLVDVQPVNQNDPMQVASAHVMKSILQYRLTKSIKWYLTCMGAWQDTRVYGPCCTYTNWEFVEREVTSKRRKKDALGEELGDLGSLLSSDEPQYEDVTEMEVIKDEPVIEMLPPENLLLDPECDWRDPVNSSPYAIRLVPMHLDDILAKMEAKDDKTKNQQWIKYSIGEILSVGNDKYNSVRQAREGDERPDKTDAQERDEFKVIWCHENYVRLGGDEYVYWTLSTGFLLTQPTPLKDVYHTGKRPLTYGFSVIEAHRFSPSSTTELISQLQTGVNDIANLRTDNVKLCLNKRYIIRRGAAVDLESLMRSVPGGGIVTDDPERDVKVIDTRDVTGSSYREQERLETESNDLSGTFMGGSVQNNRALNETVGGMEMLSEGANAISEFDIRTFVESWVRPQLELLIQYIQAYETDDVIFHTAFDEAFKKLGYKYNAEESSSPTEFTQDDVESIKNSVLNDKLTINVNIGLGATSPQKKIDMIKYTLDALVNIPGQVERLDGDEIAKEIFSAAGFQNGARFIKGNKPGEEEKKVTEQDVQEAYEQGVEAGTDAAKMAGVEAVKEVGMRKIEIEDKLRTQEMQSKERIALGSGQTKMDGEGIKSKDRRDIAASQSKIKQEELEYKRNTGKPGI